MFSLEPSLSAGQSGFSNGTITVRKSEHTLITHYSRNNFWKYPNPSVYSEYIFYTSADFTRAEEVIMSEEVEPDAVVQKSSLKVPVVEVDGCSDDDEEQ